MFWAVEAMDTELGKNDYHNYLQILMFYSTEPQSHSTLSKISVISLFLILFLT